jgi:hypothetical protein
MRVLGLVLAAVVLCSSAPVQGQPYTNFGEGTAPCGEWTEHHHPQQLAPRTAIQNSWLHGFLTAASLYRAGGPDFATPADSFGAIAWVSNYCRQNPLDNLAKAANALANELRRRIPN